MTAMLATFMEVLDTGVATIALPHNGDLPASGPAHSLGAPIVAIVPLCVAPAGLLRVDTVEAFLMGCRDTLQAIDGVEGGLKSVRDLAEDLVDLAKSLVDVDKGLVDLRKPVVILALHQLQVHGHRVHAFA